MNYLKNLMKMNKFDKETLYQLVKIMIEDGDDNLEYKYYSFDDDAKEWPVKMKKKRIIIKNEDLDENR